MIMFEMNGQELLHADFYKGHNNMVNMVRVVWNPVVWDPEHPFRSLTTTIKWESHKNPVKTMKQNKVNLKLDGGTKRNLDADFEWDLNNPAAMTMKVHGKGQNQIWGNYEISRDIKMSFRSGVFKLDVEGDANMEKFFMPSPIKTVLKFILDMNNNDYMLDVSKDFDGKKMGVVLNNGRISLTL